MAGQRILMLTLLLFAASAAAQDDEPPIDEPAPAEAPPADVPPAADAPPADTADSEMMRERNIDRHLRNPQGDKPVVVKRLSDYQLQVALDYLKSWAVFSKQSVKKG